MILVFAQWTVDFNCLLYQTLYHGLLSPSLFPLLSLVTSLLKRTRSIAGEAEALQFLEIRPRRFRHHVIQRPAGHRLVAGVGDLEEPTSFLNAFEPALSLLEIHVGLFRLALGFSLLRAGRGYAGPRLGRARP